MSSVLSAPTSTLTANVIKAPVARDLTLDEVKFFGFPHGDLDQNIADWRSDNHQNFLRGFEKVRIALENGIPHFYGRLWAKHISASGEVTDYGLISMRVVTTVGANYIAGCFAGTVGYSATNMRYHGIGTGSTAEAVGDTALAAEITGSLNPDNTRATGTLATGSSNNIFRTVGTNTVDGTVSVREHGIFSQASTAGGTLLDRSVFSAISMSSGDSLQTTYELTFTAGS